MDEDLLERLRLTGIIPVISAGSAEDFVQAAGAVKAGGLNCAEITLRTPCALEALGEIVKRFPDMLVGAGTVINPLQAEEAVKAGAKFIVSPGYNGDTAAWCAARGVPVIPGCATPGEVQAAVNLGLKAVKIFPAEQVGGVNYIKSISAPYPGVRFMATGGVNAANMGQYLAFDKMLCIGGSWFVSRGMIDAHEFGKITELTREAVGVMLGVKLRHIGINETSGENAEKTAGLFSLLTGGELLPNSTSIFVGKEVEVMKKPFLGDHGHIALETNDVERAVYFFRQQGFAFNESTRSYDEKGVLKTIYFKDFISGFAVHLVQK